MIDMGAVLGGRAMVGKRCHIGAGAVLAGVVERIVRADQQQTEMIVKSLGMTMDQYMEQLRAIPAFAMACNSFVTLAMGGMLLSAIMAPLAKRG